MKLSRACVVLAALLACNEENVEPRPPAVDDGGGGGGSGGGGSYSAPITWEPCPLFTSGQGATVECATIAVPLRWTDPEGPTIPLFVKRALATKQPARGAIWLLTGGPGGSGEDFEPLLNVLTSTYYDDVDVYLPDHRGTGRSTRLGCPDQESAESVEGVFIADDEWPDCIAYLETTWGAGLAGFSTTDAASDLGWLIAQTRAPGSELYFYGGSYGTYLAQRYLQLFPDTATAVILGGIVPPGFSMSGYDAAFDAAGEGLFALCAADPFRADKLGADPWQVAKATFDGLEQGACPAALDAGLTREVLRNVFASVVFEEFGDRIYLPAIIYRLHRCNEADAAALAHLGALVNEPEEPATELPSFSDVLNHHVILSELWTEHGVDELQAIVDDAVVSWDTAPAMAALHESWPRYVDALAGQWPTTNATVLLMNGELDPATPLGSALLAADHYTAPNQQFVTIPRGVHNVFTSPAGGRGASCGFTLFLDVLDHPGDPGDGWCLPLVWELDFTGDAEAAMAIFGVSDAWENPAVNAAAAREGAASAFVRRYREGRRRN